MQVIVGIAGRFWGLYTDSFSSYLFHSFSICLSKLKGIKDGGDILRVKSYFLDLQLFCG